MLAAGRATDRQVINKTSTARYESGNALVSVTSRERLPYSYLIPIADRACWRGEGGSGPETHCSQHNKSVSRQLILITPFRVRPSQHHYIEEIKKDCPTLDCSAHAHHAIGKRILRYCMSYFWLFH